MKRAYLQYGAALLLFGSNGIVASGIGLASYEIVFYRTLIGSLFLSAVFWLTGQKPTVQHCRRDLLLIALSGICMGASWMFLYEAYAQAGVGSPRCSITAGRSSSCSHRPFCSGKS